MVPRGGRQQRGGAPSVALPSWRSGTADARIRHGPVLRRDLLSVVTILYTAFLLVLVPIYLFRYGPTNFLYFCDVSLLLTAVSLWTRWNLPASMAAVGILTVQALWTCDLLVRLAGHPLLGMTDYMFNAETPLFLRLLSLFHVWLPLLLVGVVWRLGYDRRAYWAWTALGTVLLLVSYFLLPAPPAPPSNPLLPVNVNLVYGFSDEAPQTMMPPLAWLALLVVGMPLVCYLPAHLLLRRFRSPRAG